eukprot:TRINITY_DN36324_c0_g1_i2.p1 TRINITY_DN36324_c0_g1~~TRINITY_DN36324_c0_g1_i2.p1  ORF type:complete len:903 (-),score=130.73 TRINITY_DN36324_c0_g1_i2:61-2769(-)
MLPHKLKRDSVRSDGENQQIEADGPCNFPEGLDPKENDGSVRINGDLTVIEKRTAKSEDENGCAEQSVAITVEETEPDPSTAKTGFDLRTRSSLQEFAFLRGGSEFESMTDVPSDNLAIALQERIAARTCEMHGEVPDDLMPTVAFECPIHFCHEDDGAIAVNVIRIGTQKSCQRRSAVKYVTHDVSAVAGKKYEETMGTLYFEAGERRKAIDIRIIADDQWDCTLEFGVDLVKDDLQAARLSRYSHSTRVKILDNDVFPTNKFAKELKDERQEEGVPPHLLMREYFKMNMGNPVVRLGFLKTLLSDSVSNLSFVLDLFLDMWMVDYVLCSDASQCSPDSAPLSLFLIVLLKVLPLPLDHYLRYRRNFWKVGGASRMTLQSNLMRKYLSYDEQSLSEVNAAKLILALTRDSQEVVADGFCQLPKLVSALVRLALIVLYQLFVPVALGKTLSAARAIERMIPVFAFPIAIGTFLWLRMGTTLKFLEHQHEAQNSMLSETRQTITNRSLIQDYLKRGVFIERFIKKIQECNIATVNTAAVSTNNEQFARWCTLLVLTVYIPIGGIQVVSGDGTFLLGTFLSNVAIIKALGTMCTTVYTVLLQIMNTFESLQTIVHFMNLPTDCGLRAMQQKENAAMCRSRTAEHLEAQRADCPMDSLCIEMRSLSFQYNQKGHIGSTLQPSTCILPQGGLYTFCGPPSEGKGTILKLLGGNLLPYHPGFERSAAGGGGTLTVPSHLRVLHVSKDPMFTQDTLLDNLRFGCVKDTGDDRLERIEQICKRCAVSENLLESIKENKLKCRWLEMLSSTESACLHVARALIANPEVLVIHKPALFLNTEMADSMYSLLQEFVHLRGLGMDAKEIHNRRPRTCIVSARRIAGTGAKVADAVFTYSAETGLRHLFLEETA